MNCQELIVTAEARSSTFVTPRSLLPQDDADNEPTKPTSRPNRALRDGIRCPSSPALASDIGRPTPLARTIHDSASSEGDANAAACGNEGARPPGANRRGQATSRATRSVEKL